MSWAWEMARSKHYNRAAIIAVGYKVNSKRAVQELVAHRQRDRSYSEVG